jgi:hypothetical protein
MSNTQETQEKVSEIMNMYTNIPRSTSEKQGTRFYPVQCTDETF